MPELPEVETVRRGLARAMVGRRIDRVVVARRDLRRRLPDDFEDRVGGRVVTALGRRAKYLIVALDDGAAVLAHLGMSGRMSIGRNEAGRRAGRHEHVVFALDDGAAVRYADPRRFGLMALAEPGGLDDHELLAGLGPEPVCEAFDGPALARALAGRRVTIKAALLDQRVVAGLGNIYACEALFAAGISPRRQAASLGAGRAAALAAAIRETLEEAIAAGGSTLRDHAAPDGALGYFQHRFKVYDRAGRPCPGCDCQGGVRRIVQSGRSSFYCARRQR